MSKVEFTYGKGGKKVLMARRYAETLRKLGHGSYAVEEGDYKTRMLVRGENDIRDVDVVGKASEAVYRYAIENEIDIMQLQGTGKNGKVLKSDVDEAIKGKDLV
jgi:RNase P/RNase MRP subunit p30